MMNRKEASDFILAKGAHALYAELFPDWADALAFLPERMHRGVVQWAVFGIYPGGFLSAVVENNLFQTIDKADGENVKLLVRYCTFFYNYAPSECYGSAEKVGKWHEKGGVVGF